MARNDPQMRIRLPAEVKEWLERQATKNLRTQNAEIVFALRSQMQVSQETSKPDGVKA